MHKQDNQRGAVSLFVVIFTTVLVTIVTVSFVRIMLQNQQNASVVDLSQGAYDSALAGVEDAKRVLADDALVNGDQCNSIKQSLGGTAADVSETTIQTQVGDDNGCEQAYTCVKVDTEPKQLEADLTYQNTDESSVMLPMRTVNDQRFKTIEVSWSLPLGEEDNSESITFPTGAPKLVRGGDQWGERTPALIRAQLIQYDNSFTLGDMSTDADGKASDDARTKFLYPSAGVNPSTFTFVNDSAPTATSCNETTGRCTVRLTFDDDKQFKQHVFLRLTALYNNAHITVRAYPDTANPAQALGFKGVQATVDSTGRAGDAFRRVKAVVNLQASNTFPYPQAAIELDGNLCKTFGVTDKAGDYTAGACAPARDAPESTDGE